MSDTKIAAMDYAVRAGAPPKDLVNVAQDIWAWLNRDEKVQEASSQVVETVPSKPVEIRRKHLIKALSSTQKAVLRVAIDLYLKGEIVNSVSLHKINAGAQSTLSYHLKNLVRHGYMRRENHRSYIPTHKPDGSELETVVTVVPPGVAKGYKPHTGKLGDIGRVK